MSSGDDDYGNPQRESDHLRRELTQLREAVRVLGEECNRWRLFDSDADESSWPDAWRQHRDFLYDAQKATDANPIARAAVEATGSPDPSPAPDTRIQARGEP